MERVKEIKMRVVMSTIMVILLVLSMVCSIGEARRMMDDVHPTHGVSSMYHSSVYETAKKTLAFWLQNLASGPSDGGAGH